MSIVSTNKQWAEQLIELYKQGYSDSEVAAEMKITVKEYYTQINENAVFAKLVEFGRTLSMAFWEGQARKNLTNKSFNSSLYSFYMKNKYGWAEKVESKSENENLNTDLDGLRTQVQSEVAKFIKRHTPELTDAQRLIQGLGSFNEQE